MTAPGFSTFNSASNTAGAGIIKSHDSIIENCSDEVLEIYHKLEPFNFEDKNAQSNPNRVAKVIKIAYVATIAFTFLRFCNYHALGEQFGIFSLYLLFTTANQNIADCANAKQNHLRRRVRQHNRLQRRQRNSSVARRKHLRRLLEGGQVQRQRQTHPRRRRCVRGILERQQVRRLWSLPTRRRHDL